MINKTNRHYNEEGIQKLIKIFKLKSNSLEEALEEIGIESDEVAERLGSEIQKRLIDSNSGKWYGRLTSLGTVVSLGVGYFLRKEYGVDGVMGGMIVALPLIAGGMTLGGDIDIYLQKRELQKLKDDFPEKKEDIERMMELKSMYFGLEIVSIPPIG